MFIEDVIHEVLEVARRAGEPERARDPLVLAHRVSHTLFSAGRLLGCAAGEIHPHCMSSFENIRAPFVRAMRSEATGVG